MVSCRWSNNGGELQECGWSCNGELQKCRWSSSGELQECRWSKMEGLIADFDFDGCVVRRSSRWSLMKGYFSGL